VRERREPQVIRESSLDTRTPEFDDACPETIGEFEFENDSRTPEHPNN
jgi:hypothetical protein